MLHVQFLMLWQGLAVLLLVGGQLGFDFFQLRFELVRLLGQEFGGLGGPLGTGLDVLVENRVTSSLATRWVISGFRCSKVSLKAMVPWSRRRDLTLEPIDSIMICLRISSIFSDTVIAWVVSLYSLYFSMILNRFSRVITRWRMTSIRSSIRTCRGGGNQVGRNRLRFHQDRARGLVNRAG
jgi:hypothetical protein